VGISFDNEGMEEKLKKFTADKEMPWPQIFEGKGWNTALGEQYDVSGIPFVLLVDGDTGEILGTARDLRGPRCSEFIGKQLAECDRSRRPKRALHHRLQLSGHQRDADAAGLVAHRRTAAGWRRHELSPMFCPPKLQNSSWMASRSPV